MKRRCEEERELQDSQGQFSKGRVLILGCNTGVCVYTSSRLNLPDITVNSILLLTHITNEKIEWIAIE